MGFSSFENIFCTLFCSCLHVLFLHEPNKKFPSSETFSPTRLSGPKSKAVVSVTGRARYGLLPSYGQLFGQFPSVSNVQA